MTHGGCTMPRWLEAGRVAGGAFDRRCAIAIHRTSTRPAVLRVFSAVSHLSDAWVWLLLLPLLVAFGGAAGPRAAWLMFTVGAVNLAIYSILKRFTRRPRPFEQCPGVRACVPAADQFSFPSGHTLHAVAFACLLSNFYPAMALPLWAFAALVAASRVVLGLHYPSDVLVGAALGMLSAAVALWP